MHEKAEDSCFLITQRGNPVQMAPRKQSVFCVEFESRPFSGGSEMLEVKQMWCRSPCGGRMGCLAVSTVIRSYTVLCLLWNVLIKVLLILHRQWLRLKCKYEYLDRDLIMCKSLLDVSVHIFHRYWLSWNIIDTNLPFHCFILCWNRVLNFLTVIGVDIFF
jgi:hypothetical protein